ncbi:putative membrane protein [Propionispora sp. 2/2-37]|uniref:phage holin family protein n=1 Tax=Propionispora sp. 2/2-37 TaxID=1677858 RepID=UPI0006BB8DE3|nr:phage holin family protein [Propionispora sp. 2/2-37]CUH96416.1 putative membrane protein [Propionispora sp. 2/2-37]
MIEYTQIELRIMALFSAIGAVFSFLVGGVDKLITALLIFVVIDYVTGLIAAWKTAALDSKKGFEGIKRKVVMLVIVIMAHWIDEGLFGVSTCRSMVIFAYLGNEGLSIIENLDRMGYGEYIPAFIREKLVRLREEKESFRNNT